MAGLCGVIGERVHLPEEVGDGLVWTGEEHTVSYEDDHISVRGAFVDAEEAVVAERDGAVILTWGEVYGAGHTSEYSPRPADGRSTAEYVAERYEKDGLDAISKLNGEFIAVIRDRCDHTVYLCTDRLAVRDTYYTRVSEDAVAFSTQIQSLSLLPGVTPSFSRDMILEYFISRRTFGSRTPLEGTYLLEPGSLLRIDLATNSSSIDRYWRPEFRPENRPFSYFVDELVARLRAAIADRTRRDQRYGVLLSGGSDSRLILAAVRERGDVTTYHMADWMNVEARTAERVALTAHADFEFLRRDVDYQSRALRRTPALSNFVGTFNQAHAEGFLEQIRDDVDVLFDGLVSNHLFRGVKIPRYSVDIPLLGRLVLPYAKPMDGIETYLDSVIDPSPSYLVEHRDIRDVLREQIYRNDGGICHHGITYDSPVDLFLFADFIPLTNKNGLFMAQNIRQHLTHSSPLLDNRIVDLALTMPISYRIGYNLVDAALERIDPALAEIPHSETGVKPSRSYPARYVEENFRKLRRKYRNPPQRPPQPHLSDGPWPNNGKLLREHPAFEETLLQHRATVEALPFLEWEGVMDCFQAHQRGDWRTDQLYRLLTFLQMPVTDRVVRSRNA